MLSNGPHQGGLHSWTSLCLKYWHSSHEHEAHIYSRYSSISSKECFKFFYFIIMRWFYPFFFFFFQLYVIRSYHSIYFMNFNYVHDTQTINLMYLIYIIFNSYFMYHNNFKWWCKFKLLNKSIYIYIYIYTNKGCARDYNGVQSHEWYQ